MSMILQFINKTKQLFLIIIACVLFIFIGEDIRTKDNSDISDNEI